MRVCVASASHDSILDMEMLSMRRYGFTLIEILIVIAMLAILMGLLVPMIPKITYKGKISATQTLLTGIAAGLERYNLAFGDYPPSTALHPGMSGTTDPASLYKYLCGTDGRGVVFRSGTLEKRYDPFITVPPEAIKRLSNNDVVIVDRWGKEIVYINCKEHTPKLPVMNNANSFDLYSTGPDRTVDPHPSIIDDIANWHK